jgi:histidyl-tRNA synthetase
LELKLGAQARGTRILALDKAVRYRAVCDALVTLARSTGAGEIILPSLEPLELYSAQVNQVFSFPDSFTPDHPMLCLRPDGRTTCELIAETIWKNRRDMKVFYVTRCWSYKRPYNSHPYVESTQFGYEILNPHSNPAAHADWMVEQARKMINFFSVSFAVDAGLRHDRGFEINCEHLGNQRTVCRGGPHSRGYGFAINIERVMLL